MLKELFILCILATSSIASAADFNTYIVTRVIDGDTVEIRAPFLPLPLKPVLSVRLLGIDTPEKAPLAKCEKELELSKEATAYARETIAAAHEVKIQLIKWDKYGGRVLGYIFIDGKSLADLQIAKGHARPYDGGTKQGWC